MKIHYLFKSVGLGREASPRGVRIPPLRPTKKPAAGNPVGGLLASEGCWRDIYRRLSIDFGPLVERGNFASLRLLLEREGVADHF